MKQLIPFNQAIAGTTKYLCLQNVRKGYGIGSKYLTALRAWQKTQQHTESIPLGLDVPIFFDWTGTVEGVTANYGHIAVRLADGRIWTDGKFYSTPSSLITNYLLGKGKYLGWGESVNDVKVIDVQGGNMPITATQQDKAIKMGLQREPTPVELNDLNWRNNPGLMIDTLWEHGGKQIYAESQKPTPPATPTGPTCTPDERILLDSLIKVTKG